MKTNSYEGEYAYDKKNGWGKFEWESGNTFEGQYVNDERCGYGQMLWTDGSIYQGMWENGIQQGLGLMFFPNSTRRAGLFENNIFKRNFTKIEEYDQEISQLQNNVFPNDFRNIVISVIEEREEEMRLEA